VRRVEAAKSPTTATRAPLHRPCLHRAMHGLKPKSKGAPRQHGWRAEFPASPPVATLSGAPLPPTATAAPPHAAADLPVVDRSLPVLPATHRHPASSIVSRAAVAAPFEACIAEQRAAANVTSYQVIREGGCEA